MVTDRKPLESAAAPAGPLSKRAAPRVVVGVDGSDAARAALTWARRAAATRGAQLEAVTMAAGAATEDLVDKSRDAALLVVGSRGRGAVTGAVLGPVTLRCVLHARCPTVVVPSPPAPAPDVPTVVVGVDGSPSARAALAAAAEEARLVGGRLEVVTAYRPAEELRERAVATASEELSRLLASDGEADRPPIDVLVEEGPAVDVLVRRAAGSHLLVVGSRGRGAPPGLVLGSVALGSLERAPCPVMVVHPIRSAAPDAAVDCTYQAASAV